MSDSVSSIKCIIPNCTKAVYSRGLCTSCFTRARSLIKQGKATDEGLVSSGLMLASKKSRAGAQLFLAAFNAAKSNHPKKGK